MKHLLAAALTLEALHVSAQKSFDTPKIQMVAKDDDIKVNTPILPGTVILKGKGIKPVTVFPASKKPKPTYVTDPKSPQRPVHCQKGRYCR